MPHTGALSPLIRCLHRFALKSLTAAHTRDFHGCPVQLQDPSGRVACLEVEAVDVLCDQTVELPQSLQLGNGEMTGVRLRVFHGIVHLGGHLPVVLPGSFINEKPLKLEILGIVSVPHSAGAPEIGYARFRAHARPDEDDHAFGGDDPSRYGFDFSCIPVLAFPALFFSPSCHSYRCTPRKESRLADSG